MSQNWTPSRPWLVPSYPDYSLPETKLYCTVWLTHPERSLVQSFALLIGTPNANRSQAARGSFWQFSKHLREPGLERGQGNVCSACVLAVRSGWMDQFLSVSHKPGVMCTLWHSPYPSDIHSSSNMTAMLVCHLATWSLSAWYEIQNVYF